MTERKPGRGRIKTLSKADVALWRAVVADVRPMRAQKSPFPPPIAADSTEETPSGAAPAVPPVAPAAPPKRLAPIPVDIDHRTRVKLRRGRLDVEARLDLHGMRQDEAHRALIDFLRRAQAQGAKIAIVVTGKGSSGESGGVLRRMTPLWLQSPQLRPIVVGFGEAARQHGGEGALYVRLRRADRAAGR